MDIERFKKNLPAGLSPPDELLPAAAYDSGEYFITSDFQFIDDGPTFAKQWFGNPTLSANFFVFAEDGGSLFAYWFHDGTKGFEDAPIVFLARNGEGSEVIANTFREFLSVLATGSDDFTADVQAVTQEEEWRSLAVIPPSLTAFREWVLSELGIAPAESPAAVVSAARKDHPDLMAWIRSLGSFKPYARRESSPTPPSDNDVFEGFARAGESFYHQSALEFAPGHVISLIVSLADYDRPEFSIVLQRARDGLSRLRRHESEFRRAAARDVLPLYGTLYSHHGLMDEIALSERIRLAAITFYPDGSAQLDYAAGDLFDGRLISMWVAPDGTRREADVGD